MPEIPKNFDEAADSGLLQPRLVRLLNRWRDEIAGWEEAANIAARGNESGVASRNRVRAHSIRGCVDDLTEIIETNASAMASPPNTPRLTP